MIDLQRFSVMVGVVLREHRLACGYTLHDVSARSRGFLKPSSVASYERAERKITLERFVKLMSMYDTPADRALDEVMERMSPRTRRKFTLDVDRLRTLNGQTRGLLDFIHRVRVARADYHTRMVSLRSGDLDTVACQSVASESELLCVVREALMGDQDREVEDGRASTGDGSRVTVFG